MKYSLLLFCALSLSAHDLYLMPQKFVVEPGQRIRIAFHNGDSFPKSQAAARPERILKPQVLSAAATEGLANLHVQGRVLLSEATIPGPGNVIVVAHSKPNRIELAPTDFEKYLKHEGLEHVIQWRAEHAESSRTGRERYSKYVKSLLLARNASDYYRHVVGFPIEIIPEANPYSLKVGDSLPIQLLFRNRPAANLQVEMAWLPPGKKAKIRIAGRTDDQGRLKIPINSKGVWRLHTVLMERCSEPEAADWESFWASLTFEIQ